MEDAEQLRGQWNVGTSGPFGVDMPAALTLLRLRGHDEAIAALFLPFWEAGGLAAFSDMKEDDR